MRSQWHGITVSLVKFVVSFAFVLVLIGAGGTLLVRKFGGKALIPGAAQRGRKPRLAGCRYRASGQQAQFAIIPARQRRTFAVDRRPNRCAGRVKYFQVL